MILPRVSFRNAGRFALVLALAACGEPSTPPAGAEPGALRVMAGDGQQATAGAELPDELAVAVLDDDGQPLPGALVQFAVVSGGGQVTPQATTSDGDGRAHARWTLGTVAADSQVVEARLPGVAPVRLRGTARADVPAALAIIAGNGAAGPVGAALTDSLAVTVKDRFGNPVPGAEVAWEVAAGGGAVSPARGLTGANGVVRTRWTLGPRVDSAQVAVGRVAGLDPAAFTANAVTAGAPLQLAKRGGDGQRGPAGGVLADSLGVVLRMPDGRPVAGALVRWSVPPEAGTVVPAVSRTDANGAAAAVWRLGTRTGLSRASVTVDAGTLYFTALTEADTPTELTPAGGDGGSGPVGSALADSLAVRVRDRHGNPVPGAVIAWAALDGSGSLQPARSATDAEGVARTQWILGPRVDAPQVAQATLDGHAPVAFHASATTLGATLLLVKRGGDGQRGAAGGMLADSLGVVLRMPDGHPVMGAAVAWSAPAGAGTVTPAESRTDARGFASAAWRLGTIPGLVQATATVDGGTLVFTSLVEPAAPAAVVAAGGGSEGPVGGPLADSLAARVVDAYGNPVPGVEVFWGPISGGGTVQPARGVTNDQGVVRAQWILGPLVGTPGQATSASVAGLPAATFAATAVTRGVPLRFAIVDGHGQQAEVGHVLPESLTVELRTQSWVRVQGAAVTWSVVSGGGQVSPATSRTDAQGRARAAWTMGPTPRSVEATARVDDGVLTFSATALAGAPAGIQVAAGNGQSGTRGTILRTPIQVRVVDASGLPVSDAWVRWSVETGGGHVESDSTRTNYDGRASTRWAVGMTPGDNAATATVNSLPSVRFTATGVHGAHYLHGGGEVFTPYYTSYSQMYQIDETLDAYVADAQGNRVVGAPIMWTSIRAPLPAPRPGWEGKWSWRFDLSGGLPPIATARFEGQQVQFYVPFDQYWSIRMVPPWGSGPHPASQPIPLNVTVTLDFPEEFNSGFSDQRLVLDVAIDLHDDNGWTARVTSNYDRVQVQWPVGSKTGQRTLTACVTLEYSDVPICSQQTFNVVP